MTIRVRPLHESKLHHTFLKYMSPFVVISLLTILSKQTQLDGSQRSELLQRKALYKYVLLLDVHT